MTDEGGRIVQLREALETLPSAVDMPRDLIRSTLAELDRQRDEITRLRRVANAALELVDALCDAGLAPFENYGCDHDEPAEPPPTYGMPDQ